MACNYISYITLQLVEKGSCNLNPAWLIKHMFVLTWLQLLIFIFNFLS